MSVFSPRWRFAKPVACLGALGSGLFCMEVPDACAAEWSITDIYSSTVDYNSNRRLESESKGDDAAIISADILFKRALETLELTLEPHYVLRRYTDPSVGNGDDRTINAGLRWNSSETSLLSLDASYWDQSTLSTGVLETVLISGQTHRRTSSGSGSWTYGQTESLALVAQANYQDVSFYGQNANSLPGYRYPSGSLGEKLTLNEHGSITISGFGSSLKSDAEGNSSHEYGVQAELIYQLSDLTNLDLSLGESARLLAGRSGHGTTASVSLVHSFELGHVSLGYTRSLVPYATGFLVEREQFTAALSHSWSSSLDSALTLYRYQNNRDTVQLRLDRREYNSLAASLSWRPTETTWSIGGTVEGIRTETPDLSGDKLYAWRCSLSITWSPRPKSISR